MIDRKCQTCRYRDEAAGSDPCCSCWEASRYEESIDSFFVNRKQRNNEDVPTADVKPVVRGKWTKQHKDFDLCGVEYFACDKCGFECQLTYNFCPNCGAEMDGGQDKAEIIYGIDMNTSTSNFTPTKRMCRQTGQMCEFAGDYGYCKITACVKRRHSKGETEHG